MESTFQQLLNHHRDSGANQYRASSGGRSPSGKDGERMRTESQPFLENYQAGNQASILLIGSLQGHTTKEGQNGALSSTFSIE